jgi:hypothetical protein
VVRINVTPSGAQSGGPAEQPGISADGSVVVFRSVHPDVVSPYDSPRNWWGGVLKRLYVRDVGTGLTESASDGVPCGVDGDHDLDGDGDTVVFMSRSRNLSGPDTGCTTQVPIGPPGGPYYGYEQRPNDFDIYARIAPATRRTGVRRLVRRCGGRRQPRSARQ